MAEEAKQARATAIKALDKSWRVFEGLKDTGADLGELEEGLKEVTLLHDDLIEKDDAYNWAASSESRCKR